MKNKLFLITTTLTHVALLAAATFLAASTMNVRAAAFTAGDLALVVAAGSGSNTNCSVVEINTTTAAQAAIQTIAIPATGASAIRVSSSATSTLYVSDSNDGSLLAFTGVNLDQGTGNANTLNPRAVVTLDATGNVAIPTTYTGGSGNQSRGATTVNNSFWYVGDQGGYYTNGSTAAVTSGNLRSVKAFGGTVYSFTASASVPPVNTLTASGTITALPGLPVGATSMQDFYLISSGSSGSAYDVLYILSATSATAGTIAKYSLVSGTWTANGTYTTTIGGFGLCATKSGSGAFLYVSTGTGATINNSVIKLTDTAGFNTTIAITTGNNVTLYTASSGAIIKGLAFAPISTLAIDNTGTPAAGSVQTGLNNVPLFGFQLTPNGSSANFTALKLTTAGTATSSDLNTFRVYFDADNSGTISAGDVEVSASAQALANSINFTITGQTGFNSARRYLVAANISGAATVGRTFTGSIAAAVDVTASITPNGTAAGNQQTIAAAIYDLTMSPVTSSESPTISSLVNDATITTTSQGAQAWQVTISNPAGNAGGCSISALNFTQGANNGVANWANVIQAAKLFNGSTALAAGTIGTTNISFTGLGLAEFDGSSATLTLRISLKTTAGALTDNTHFQFNLNGTDVTVNGNNGVTTAAVTSDQTQNQITVVATKLAFTIVPIYVITNTTFTVQVSAQDANGNLDLDNTSSVNITVATGGGTLGGGGSLPLTGGNKKWTALSYDTVGLFSLTATDDGAVLTTATSANITALLAPTLTEVVMPQYIQGGNGSKRLPFAFRLALSNLLANANYRYYNQVVLSTEANTADGAGNVIFATASGNFVRTTGPGMNSTGNYGAFTTDANGSYTGWFITEPTGNAAKFGTAGTQDYMRIMLNDGNGGTSVFSRVTTPDYATVLAFGTTADAATGTGIYGNSSATNKNFVVLYDNVAGTGRPLAATFVESDGLAENTAASYVLFYNNNVDGVSGAWGNIIPNSNANGVQRIEQRALADGSLVGVNTAANGVWPSTGNTVNPSGGDATPIVITGTDAPLNSTGSVTTPAITNIQVSGGNVLIDFTGGASDVVGNFTVLSTGSLTVAFAPIAATITTSGPGVFRATVPFSAVTPAAFYRIQR